MSSEIFKFAVLNDIPKTPPENESNVKTEEQVSENSLHTKVKKENQTKTRLQKETIEELKNVDKDIVNTLKQGNEISEEILDSSISSYQRLLTSESESKKNINLLAKEFVNSENFVADSSSLNYNYKKLFEWLYSQKNSITWKDVVEFIKKSTGLEPNRLVTMNTFQQDKENVADSLLASTILAGELRTDITDQLTKTSRTFSIIEQSAEKTNIDETFPLDRMLEKRILLPRYAFSKNLPTDISSRTFLISDYKRLVHNKIKTRLQKYRNIMDEIANIKITEMQQKARRLDDTEILEKIVETDYKRKQVSKEVNTDDDVISFEVKSILDKEKFDKLSNETKEFVLNEGFDPNYFSPSDATPILEKHISKTLDELHNIRGLK